MRAKLGLGMGKIKILHLGGNGDLIQRERFEYVALGPALMDAIESEKYATPGEVVVSNKIWDLVGSHFIRTEKRGDKRHVISGWKDQSRVPWRSFDRTVPNTPEIEKRLWKYVPNAVLPYLIQSNDEFWVPELRTVTTLFFDLGLNIPELSSGQHVYKLEQVFYEIQGILLSYEGTINKFLIDDKGSTLIAVFGLPPFAHENDPIRGILSALKILWMLSKYKLQGSVGICTGLAFCGIIGHAAGNRREYSVIGDTVNLAARLMGKAKSQKGNFLVDRTTKNCATGTVLDFIPITLSLKGKSEPVHCFKIGKGVSLEHTHDFHSVQLARLDELSRNNTFILENQTDIRKGRRRNTAGAVSNPLDMKKIEERQVKAMNDPNKFTEKVAKAQRNRSGHQNIGNSSSEATAGTSTNNHGRRPNGGVPMFRIRHRLEGEQEHELHINLTGKLTTVADLIDAILHKAVKKGLLDEKKALGNYFIEWINGSECVELENARKLRDLVTSVEIPIYILFKKKGDKSLWPSEVSLTSSQTSADFVVKRLADARKFVMTGQGGRMILLDGEHGAGKSRLAEKFLLDGEDMDQHSSEGFGGAVLVGYARGNPFETGRSAVPFSVWEHLVNSLLIGNVSDPESRFAPKDEQILEATRVAMKERPSDHIDIRDLHLLNKVLLTQFIDGDGQGSTPISVRRGSSRRSSIGNGQLESDMPSKAKKYRNPTRSSQSAHSGKPLGVVGTSDAKVSRMKNLSSIGHSSENVRGSHTSATPSRRLSFTANLRKSVTRSRNSSVSSRLSTFSKLGRSLLRVEQQDQDDKPTTDPETGIMIKLLAAIVGGLATKAPVIILIDDSQHMDTFSWLVFQELAEHWMSSNILIILINRLINLERSATSSTQQEQDSQRVSVFRPLGKVNTNIITRNRAEIDDVKLALVVQRRLRSLSSVERLELRPSPLETKNIICDSTDVDRVPADLVNFLRIKTKGNPLFITDAVNQYIEAGLVLRRTSPEIELYFPNNEFKSLLRTHSLPIPLSVESIAGSMIDKMSNTQVLLIKVAAIIGDVFMLGLIRAMFPIKSRLDILDAQFYELVKVGFIVKVVNDRDLYMAETDKDKIQYSFESGWMVEILRKRMLNKQKLKLNKVKKSIQKDAQRALQLRFIEKAQGSLEVVYEGFLQVRKENPTNLLKPWKPRWCLLKGDELIQFYSSQDPKRLEVIILNGDSSVRTEPIGLFGFDGRVRNQEPQQTLYCFTITSSRWNKKGKNRTDVRDFTFACETEEERIQWVYRVTCQIDLLSLRKDSSKLGDAGARPSNGAMSNVFPTSSSDVGSSTGSDITDPPIQHAVSGSTVNRNSNLSRPSVSTVASGETPTARRGKSAVKKLFSKKKGQRSTRASTDRSVDWGVSVSHMHPEDYKAIRESDALALLWSQRPSLQPPVQHTTDLYYEAADMSLVSRNSLGEIDGYLIGKLQSQRRTQLVGLITACAVVPAARRQGIGRRLVQKFFALCRGKGCRFVRLIIPRDDSVAIAFQRSLGFEEDDYSTDLLARADDAERVCYLKDLDQASHEQDDSFVEVMNPMISSKSAVK